MCSTSVFEGGLCGRGGDVSPFIFLRRTENPNPRLVKLVDEKGSDKHHLVRQSPYEFTAESPDDLPCNMFSREKRTAPLHQHARHRNA